MKFLKFKSDKVNCELCGTEFKTHKPYKLKTPMWMVKGKPIPKKQLPKHKCKEKK